MVPFYLVISEILIFKKKCDFFLGGGSISFGFFPIVWWIYAAQAICWKMSWNPLALAFWNVKLSVTKLNWNGVWVARKDKKIKFISWGLLNSTQFYHFVNFSLINFLALLPVSTKETQTKMFKKFFCWF